MDLPSIPSLTGITDKAILSILTPIKTILQTLTGQVGDGSGEVVTYSDINSYVQDGLDTGGIVLPPGSGGYDPSTDTTIPPTPTGLYAQGAIKTILLKWDDVGASNGYYNHAYTQVWRNTVNLFDGTQQQIGTAEGSVFVDSTAVQGTTYYYWIRFVSQAGITGAYSGGSGTGVAGTLGQAGQGDLAVNSIVAGSGVIGSLAVDTALIADGAINTFKLGDGSVTNAKISGAIQSDNYVSGSTGWIINKNGTAEFNTGTFRGALAAATGTFAGDLSAATGTFSGSLTASAVNAVNTVNIAGQAVSVHSSYYLASTSLIYTSLGEVSVASAQMTLTQSGLDAVYIHGSFLGYAAYNTSSTARVRIRRDSPTSGEILYDATYDFPMFTDVDGNISKPATGISIAAIDSSVTAGAHAYYLTVSSGGVQVSNKTILLISQKKTGT